MNGEAVPAATSPKADLSPLLLLGAAGLLGAGGYLLLKGKGGCPPGTVAGAGGCLPITSCPPGQVLGSQGGFPACITPPGGGARVPFANWLAACRGDITAGTAQARYTDVLGQYLREQWPDFLNRGDVAPAMAVGNWAEVEGQWLREQAPGFFNRQDIQAAWYGSPPRKNEAVGQYIREQGGFNCLASPNPNPNPSPNPPPQPPRQPISRWQDLRAGMIVSLSCAYGVPDYLVEPAGLGLDPMPDGYEPAHRRRRWIRDQLSWNRLTTGDINRAGSRSAVYLVTAGCLNAIATDPLNSTLQYGPARGQGLIWYGQPPRVSPQGGNAGYCA